MHAFGLVLDRFHLLVRSRRGQLSAFGRQLFGQFSRRINRLVGWNGPLFRGRFRAQPVDPSLRRHMLGYIHLAPVRLKVAADPGGYLWTSHRAYLDLEPPSPWLTRDALWADLGGVVGVQAFVTALGRGDEPWPRCLDLDSGRLSGVGRGRVQTPPRQPPSAPSPDEVIAAVVTVTGADRAILTSTRRGRGGNPARRFAVWALRRATDLGAADIGALLCMSANQVGAVLWRLRHHPVKPPLDRWIAAWSQNAPMTNH